MCLQPYMIKRVSSKTDWTYQPVPCGRCPECVKAKTQSWLFRLEKEMEISSNPLFVTLTYDDQHLPWGDGVPTLYKRDVQLFMKRLRKLYGKSEKSKKIKYYFVGEYGSTTQRPHYHAVLFNLDKPELIQEAWGLGFTYSPPIKGGGISYVLKYISKPRTKDDRRENEFSLMSKEWVHHTCTIKMVGTRNPSIIISLRQSIVTLLRKVVKKFPCLNIIRTKFTRKKIELKSPPICKVVRIPLRNKDLSVLQKNARAEAKKKIYGNTLKDQNF